MANINWYPGHMAKAMRQMENDIKMVDCVCEVLDARIPISSHNPELDRLAGQIIEAVQIVLVCFDNYGATGSVY